MFTPVLLSKLKGNLTRKVSADRHLVLLLSPLLLTLIALLSLLSVTLIAADPTAGLVGHWKLDELIGTTATDSSTSNNTGTLIGGPVWSAGQLAGALSFDGIDDYVDAGSDPSLNITGEVTIAGWVNLAQTGIDQKIAGNQDGTAGGYKLGVFTNNKVEFEVRSAANAAYLNRGVASKVKSGGN